MRIEHYPELRYWLKRMRITLGGDLPIILEKSKSYVKRRMTGEYEWSRAEMFKLLDIIKMPYIAMPYIFSDDEKEGKFTEGVHEKLIELKQIKASGIAK
ncbi:hypothetical protein [uncultured Anaerofustis sp.]|uniref:hypothetical protein n=1 Tax=uncultured Anaerofustis sp. TaxID=904996 RepID=UPI0025DA6737|nr:hypothetical protein [uncultured Anaerofustis sp.]